MNKNNNQSTYPQIVCEGISIYYILKCRIHGGIIYSITSDDDICGSCAQKKELE